MPVLNPHPVYFPQAVQSVLSQTHRDLELIIVEDPSERSAQGLLAPFHDSRIRHLTNPTRTSLVKQLNRGLNEARGELVARLDADDIAEPERLAKQVAFLNAHPDVTVLGSQMTIIDIAGNVLGYRHYPRSHEAIFRSLCRFNPMGHPTVMFRKAAILKAGGYQYDRYPATEDYELWSRLATIGHRLANLPEPLLRYRIHPEGMKTAKLRGILRGTLEIKRRYWGDHMDLRARARMWAERLLLWMPPWLVLRLFIATQYTRQQPQKTLAEGALP
jgi:glycosyltransferase involved in cell wall biosynthesis